MNITTPKTLKTTALLAATVCLVTGCPDSPLADVLGIHKSPPPSTSPASTAPTATPVASTPPAFTPETPPTAGTAPPQPAPTFTNPVFTPPPPPPSTVSTPLPAATPVQTSIPTQPTPFVARATPTPPQATLAPKTDDISTVEQTTFNGMVYDDTNAPLDGVRILAKSLNASVSFSAETTTTGGAYAFNNAPAGVQVEILATKAGFTTRKRVEVLKSNRQGDPNANKYDFGAREAAGGTGSINNALSDKPEVIAVTPGRNSSGRAPKTSVVMKFSEPMDKKSVEDTFGVRAFNTRKLTVDSGRTQNTFSGDSQITTISNPLIWDKNAYNVSWNSDDTEVTFAFKEEKALPTDKDTDKVPDYQVVFNDTIGIAGRVLKDKSGISRQNQHFKLTDGPFEETYKFAITPDEVKPDLSSVVAQTNENQGVNGDSVKVIYSERMIIYTKTRTIAGGGDDISGSEQKAPAGYPGGTQATNRLAAKNYTVSITPVGSQQTTYVGTWFNLGGQAVYDTNDPTHKTVILMPPRFTGINSGQVLPNSSTTYAETNFTANTILGANPGGTIQVSASYVSADGTITPASASVPVGNNATGATFASAIVTALNNAAPGGTGWSVLAIGVGINEGFRYQYANAAPTAPVAAALTAITHSNPPVRFPSGWQPNLGDRVNMAVGLNGYVNIYAAGDTIRVVVGSTVLDPAGNTLNTSRNNGSSNAS